ncbi:hypothetical protein [Geodermatophilus sp. URMC 62]|uniref:hypothetical protein n=1 Tax=Geodermatophilus sp. URMC 62 TaxID=3423414 RepID=UPI00406D18DB
MTDADFARAGSHIAAAIESELSFEASRKASVEQRGLAVVTSSAALVTLLLGFAALVTKATDFELELVPLVLILAALAFFLFAVLQGILVNRLIEYKRIDPQDLSRLVEDPSVWRSSADVVDRRLAEAAMVALRDSQEKTNSKARSLQWGIWAQMAAVALLAGAVVLILLSQ